MLRHDLERVGRRNRRFETSEQEFARIHNVKPLLAADERR
jgi:hypothetical protein